MMKKMVPEPPPLKDWILKDVRRVADELEQFIISTTTLGREDRLWPADFQLFETNPLSLSYGACGTALFLSEENRTDSILDWVASKKIDLETYPPGLGVGCAGIAWACELMGMREEARSALKLAAQSPLLFQDASYLHGASGWGMANLAMMKATGDEEFMRNALQAGDFVFDTCIYDEGLAHWKSGLDNKIHYGVGFGASGVALFLLHLFEQTKKEEYAELVIRALDFELRNSVNTSLGRQWPGHEVDTNVLPYFIRGSAGVGAVLLRAGVVLEHKKFADLAISLGERMPVTYSFNPSLYDGLAGMGEFLLDLQKYVPCSTWSGKLESLLEALFCFALNVDDHTAFPGRTLERISNDYATGGAGIGIFLKRVLCSQPRLFVDLRVDLRNALTAW